jgi:hypothetical protein
MAAGVNNSSFSLPAFYSDEEKGCAGVFPAPSSTQYPPGTDKLPDVFIRAPKGKDHGTTRHVTYGRVCAPGNLPQVVKDRVLFVAITTKGIPANQGKFVPLLQLHRPLFSRLDRVEENRIGCAAFMNGINVTIDECLQACAAIDKHLRQRIPLIGLYNATHGFRQDLLRAMVEKAFNDFKTAPIKLMQTFLEALAERYHPQWGTRWMTLLIVHSEGAVILHNALDRLRKEQRERFKHSLCILTFGAAKPIPEGYGCHVVNCYTSNDFLLLVTNSDRSRDGCKIVTASGEGVTEHSFLGKTYQKMLAKQIDDLGKKYGIGE